MTNPSPESSVRLTLTATDAAELLGISRAQLWKLNASGRLPKPVRLGTRAPRWILGEIAAWLDAGCPERSEWERMKREARD